MRWITATAITAAGLFLLLEAMPARAASCASTQVAAAHYRTQTWRWNDTAQIPRVKRDYKAGKRTACARAKYLKRIWRGRMVQYRTLAQTLNGDIPKAIMFYFGPDVGPGAINVARCESGTNLTRAEIPTALAATNGHYHGIFQLGDPGLWEIHAYAVWRGQERYSTVVDQVAAAARMYRDRGWSAWECQP